MNINIRKEFNNIFKDQVNEEFCYIPKEEFVKVFKKYINRLNDNDFCFSFNTNIDEEEYQYSGNLKNIFINDIEIKFTGEFDETCGDNKRNKLIIPIDKINKDIKIMFYPNPWIANFIGQDFPQTTNISFYDIEKKERYNNYKKYGCTFYFSLKEAFTEMLKDKNIARKVQFLSEEDIINFFNNIKEELIGQDFSYWSNGKDIVTPVLEVKLIKEERYEDIKNLLVITTKYGIEEIYLDCMNEIQESDNYLHFDQRKWNGSEYSVKI